jgi:hypothetical protein
MGFGQQTKEIKTLPSFFSVDNDENQIELESKAFHFLN